MRRMLIQRWNKGRVVQLALHLDLCKYDDQFIMTFKIHRHQMKIENKNNQLAQVECRINIIVGPGLVIEAGDMSKQDRPRETYPGHQEGNHQGLLEGSCQDHLIENRQSHHVEEYHPNLLAKILLHDD